MALTSLEQLNEFGKTTRVYLSTHLLDFLEASDTKQVKSRLQGHKAADKMLIPAETLELEIKHKLSAASHEVLQAIHRIEDASRQHSKLDIAVFLRYARVNLLEAQRDIGAASSAYRALSTYTKRVQKASTVVEHELRYVLEKTFGKIEQLRSFQKSLLQRCNLILTRVVAA